MASRSESLQHLAPALLKVQMALRPVVRNARNPRFASHYADLNSILAEVLPHLNGNGILLLQPASVARDASGAALGVNVETQLVHAESGEFLSEALFLPCDVHNAQSIGSAVTYGRRYGVASLLGIATEADDDGNGAARARGANEGEAPAKPVPPAPSAETPSPPPGNGRSHPEASETPHGPTPRALNQLTERCFSRPGPEGRPVYHEEKARGFRPWLRDHFGVEDPRLLTPGQRLEFVKLLRDTLPGTLYDYRSRREARSAVPSQP